MNLELMQLRLRKVLALASSPFFLHAFLRHGVAPAIEHRGVLRALPFDFVTDVGANRGQFSLVCRALNSTAVIVAFEPLGEPASIYRNVFADDDRVRLHNWALGPQRGEIAMNVSGRDDSSSLLPISSLQTKNFPGTEAVDIRMVRIGPLSDFVQPGAMGSRNLLKIDVQGFELEVLKSAESLLPGFDWIYAECSFAPLYEGQAMAEEIIGWLRDHSFDEAGRFNPSRGRGNELLQADLLFKNRNRA